MKKILSVLLAVAMLMAILPSMAFAMGEESNAPVEYLINTSVAKTAITTTLGSGSFTSIDTYDEIDGAKTALWAYNSSTPGSSTKNMTGARVMVQFAKGRFESDNAFISFKLKVDNPGWYDLAFCGAQYKFGPDIDVYFGSSTRTAMVPAYKSELSLIGTVKTYEENASGGSFDHQYDVGKVYIPTAGDYFILFNCISSGHYDTGDVQRIYLSKIMLNSTPPTSIEVSPAQFTLNDGEESEAITAVVKDKVGNVLSGAKITYESENSDVATVDAETGKIVAVGDGETDIVVKVEGYDVSTKIHVSVRDYTHKYIFNTGVMSDEAIAEATKAAQDAGDRNVGYENGVLRKLSFIDNFDAIDTSKGTDAWHWSTLGSSAANIAGGQFNMSFALTSLGHDNPASRFVLKLKVKYPGTYDLGIECGKHATAALSADIYMLKADGITALSNAVIRGNKKIGTIDGSVGSSVNDSLGVVSLEAGDYYLVFDLWNKMSQGATKHNFYPKSAKLTLHEGGVAEDDNSVTLANTKLSFAIGSTDSAEITVNGNVHNGNTVYSFDRADEITVKAGIAPDGKQFKAWVQGTADNGIWKSSDEEYTFKMMTHTYLTAVYEDAPSDDTYIIEYYNENGKYHATKEASGTTPVLPENPSLTGYTFDMWTLDGETKFDETSTLTGKLTRAIAKYNANAIGAGYAVKYNGTAIADNDFGSKVDVSDKNATHWLRDGKVVAYGTEYTHYIWDGTSIYCSYAPIEKNPVIVIEDTLVDGANMIEYDAGNKEIIEVGILYGTATVDVSSCRYKATSQWEKKHGQFTASKNSDEEFARGYLIYDDGGVYKVIYTEAIAIK